ncbi:hypothetical protein [Glycomyces tarimensis]
MRSSPRDRYLVGQLGPKTLRGPAAEPEDPDANPDTLDDGESMVVGTEDAELPDKNPPVDAGRLWASSMGLSFKLAPETESVHITAEWGHYEKVTLPDDDGKERRQWQRSPVVYEREIRLAHGTERLPLTGSSPDEACVLLHVETRRRDDCTVVDVSLVNGQREPRFNASRA